MGLGTLPPSIHRADSNFRYQYIGQNKLLIQDGLYDGIVKLLGECLKSNVNPYAPDTFNSGYIGEVSPDFSEQEIQSICEYLRPYYYKGCSSRNDMVFALCGLCRKYNVSKESTRNLIERLTIEDEEKKSRILVLDDTYNKDPKYVRTMKYHRFSRRRKPFYYVYDPKSRKKSNYMINTGRSKILSGIFFENQVWGGLHT
jgi:hypothetical protein